MELQPLAAKGVRIFWRPAADKQSREKPHCNGEEGRRRNAEVLTPQQLTVLFTGQVNAHKKSVIWRGYNWPRRPEIIMATNGRLFRSNAPLRAFIATGSVRTVVPQRASFGRGNHVPSKTQKIQVDAARSPAARGYYSSDRIVSTATSRKRLAIARRREPCL